MNDFIRVEIILSFLVGCSLGPRSQTGRKGGLLTDGQKKTKTRCHGTERDMAAGRVKPNSDSDESEDGKPNGNGC